MATKKTVPKKTPPKKGAAPRVEVEKKASPRRASSAPKEGVGVIDQLIALVNKEFGGTVMRRASESSTSHTLRRPTGIPDLDIGLAGGFPAGALCVVTGPDGAGKDYIINCTIRELQRNYGDLMKVAIYSTEFPYDKRFAREICGVEVAFTDEELEEYNDTRMKQGHPPLTAEEREAYQRQIGEILLVQGVIADHGLDIVLKTLETGAFQLIAINSLGVFETAAKENTDSLEEHAAQSSEAQLLSRFMPKMFMHLNRPIDDERRNETSLIAANQVRANRDMPRMKPGMPVPQHMKYQPGSGSKALAHGKAIDVMLHKGTALLDKEVDPPVNLGRTINWVLEKGKLGTHDGIKGSYDFYYDGGADIPANLLAVGVRLEVIQQAGAWYSYQDGEVSFCAQGGDQARVALRDPAVAKSVYNAVIKTAGFVCRYT